ncbi:MAG TPA: AAA family ATPase [Candidatus Babeliales bacterium]|nr:AAA family ATPase [Candidatus Babeliales bacterium]
MFQYQKLLLSLILCSYSILFSAASNPCYMKGMAGKQPKGACDTRDFFKAVNDYSKEKFLKGPCAHIFSGPIGIGKLSTALAIAQEANVKVVILTVEELSDPNINTMKVIAQIYKDADEYVQKNNRPIIIIFRGLEEPENTTGLDREKYIDIVEALKIATQDRFGNPRVTTIITTTDWKRLNDALVSRCMFVKFDLSDKNDRLEILKFVARKHHTQLPSYMIRAIALSSKGKIYPDFDQAVGKYANEHNQTLTLRNQMKLFHSLAKQNYTLAGATVITSLAITLGIIYGTKYLPKINLFQGTHHEN